MVSLNKQQGLSTHERKEAMPFKPNLQSSLAVLIALLVLLTACSPFSGNPVTASTPTVQPTHQVTPTHTVNSVTDSCPAGLSQDPNCYTPHALRVAYGLEALTEQGFTGKGQTVIDIVSFGSPTFINWLLLKAFKEIFGISRVAAIGLIEVIFIYRVFRHSPAGMQ